MKRILYTITLLLSLIISGCSTDLYDYDELTNRIDLVEKRLAALEEWCKETNTNIHSLKTLVESLLQHDMITGMTPVMKDGVLAGYTITFLNGDPITIYHGQDGKDGTDGEDGKDGLDGQDGLDGYTPVVGVKQHSDGLYYWTLDGDWLTDAQGNKIKAQGEKGEAGADGTDGEDGEDGKDAVAPQLKIENKYWYISYDNGNTWTQLDKAIGEDGAPGTPGTPGAPGAPGTPGEKGESFFQSVDTSNPDYVLFTLIDGTPIKIPTWSAFEALQTLCNQLNTNVSSLQTLVTALQDKDYVESVTPLVQNSVEIGYTITFSKSGAVVIYHGKDGQNGAPGTPGTPGAPGLNGNTPQIGVKQDTDGVYYWTVGTEWLTDAQGNKIKAQGEKGEAGKDAIAPKLKIENQYWYISYDGGQNWTKLEKAVGEDGQPGTPGAPGVPGTPGAPGQKGDSFFQNVEVTGNSIKFTLSDGTVITIPVGNPSVASQVSDITYIPRYEDGKATAYYKESGNFEKSNVFVDLDFTISPKSILPNLTQDLLSVKAVYTESRATITPVTLTITSFAKDAATGNIALTVSCANLSDEYFASNAMASIALCISDDAHEVYSAYIPLVAPKKKYKQVIYYTSTNGEIVAPSNLESVLGVKILSHTYENGQGMIALGDEITVMEGFNNRLGYSTRLKSITIPEGITTIGDFAFDQCSALESVTLPSTLKEIGKMAFCDCKALKTINLPVSVKTIGPSAFSKSGLTKMNLPNGLETIEENAFWGCEFLSEVTFPASIQTIEKSAFYKCIALTEVTLPNGLQNLAEDVFASCDNLAKVILPANLTNIGERAFWGCESLEDITIPAGVTRIESEAFWICRTLKKVVIPSSVTYLGTKAFDACNALEEIVCKATTPPTLGADVFAFPYSSQAKIKVPTTSVSIYKTKWSAFKDYITDGGF